MFMYLQEEISKRNLGRKLIFCWYLESLSAKNRRIRIRNSVYGSKDPDPCQNVRDPEHCFSEPFVRFFFPLRTSSIQQILGPTDSLTASRLPLSASINQTVVYPTAPSRLADYFLYLFIYIFPFSLEEIV